MATSKNRTPSSDRRERLRQLIFGTETRAGRLFDVFLFWAILLSVLVVVLDSVEPLHERYGSALLAVEWLFTVLFSVEYGLRLYCAPQRTRYAFSFFGFVDLVAVIPTYLSVLVTGAQSLLIFRALRLLRIFRVLKLVKYLGEANVLLAALRGSRYKITVFLGAVLTTVLIMGALMYLIEGQENGFTSIPTGMYWAVVTMTTVGYGDIAPRTVLGQTLAGLLMILGYGIIAVPTGIVSAELVEAGRQSLRAHACPSCGTPKHDADALYCKRCGQKL